MTDTPPEADLPWPDIRAWFERALPLDAVGRDALLADPALDPAVAAEVRSLLAHEAPRTTASAGFMSQGAAATLAPEPGREGQVLGAWRITDKLGSGGMGEVWLAQRDDGAYAGQAAIKVLKRGMDSAAVLARFALEQQALARMQHPHIAHLLDAGRTADGLPFFVMERVQGQPIDAACEGLGLHARLRLFLQLTDAVAYAHRQLLVHRDLKPSNVLVNDEGQVKLLDFGIAKALDVLAQGGTQTVAGERPFTPLFASPEQVRGEPVGTGTDIYSLGVLLYVMLTGVRPYGRDATSAHEAARSVLEEQPTRPSSLSPQVVTDKQWLTMRERLKGDLDNILLKALAKDIEPRYASVDALAQDVRAFIDGYPVGARPTSLGYRSSKWIGRNRLAAAGLALGAVGVLGGLAASLWQARQAVLARDDARAQLTQIKRITNDLVFRYGDTVTTLPGGAAAQEGMLKATIASLEPALKSAPNDVDLQVTMASALGRLAEIQGSAVGAAPERAGDARTTVDRALALAEPAWASQRGDWRFASWHARSLVVLAQLFIREAKLPQAAQTLQKAAARADESNALQTDDEGRAYLTAGSANARLTLAQVYDHVNRPSLNRAEDALREYSSAEKTLRQLLAQPALLQALDRGAPPGDVATEAYLTHQLGTLLGGRALVHQKQEDLPAMRTQAEAAMVLRRQNIDREPRNVHWRDGLMTEANTWAVALIRSDEMPQALQASTLSWQTAEALAADEGPKSKWAGVKPFLAPQYGRALAGNGRHAQALEVYDIGLKHWQAQAEEAAQKQPGNLNPARRVAWFQVQRAQSQAAMGNPAAAISTAEKAVAALDALVGDAAVGRDAQLALAQAHALLATLQPDDAGSHRTAAIAALQAAKPMGPAKRLGADHEKLLASLS
jgi:eukaryotic-like serine/threonine-protein kinase